MRLVISHRARSQRRRLYIRSARDTLHRIAKTEFPRGVFGQGAENIGGTNQIGEFLPVNSGIVEEALVVSDIR
jgi:hypothetical protein